MNLIGLLGASVDVVSASFSKEVPRKVAQTSSYVPTSKPDSLIHSGRFSSDFNTAQATTLSLTLDVDVLQSIATPYT